MRPQVLLRAAFLAVAACASAAYADGGRVLEAEDTSIVRSRDTRQADKGDVVQAGDEIHTGKSGRAKWWMEDDAVYELANNTEFRIEEFVTPKKKDATPGRWIARLLKGGFRAVSGLVGKGSRDTYEVRTEVATMGIRGTTWAAFLCTGGNCEVTGKKGARKLADGLYAKVDEGKIVVWNARGSLEVAAGRIVYVASADQAPILVREAPDILLALDITVDAEALGVPARIEVEIDVPASPSQP